MIYNLLRPLQTLTLAPPRPASSAPLDPLLVSPTPLAFPTMEQLRVQVLVGNRSGHDRPGPDRREARSGGKGSQPGGLGAATTATATATVAIASPLVLPRNTSLPWIIHSIPQRLSL